MSLKVSQGVSTTFSAELSSKVGWNGADIPSRLGITYEASKHLERIHGPIQIPEDRKYTIYCAPLYNYYSFQVWKKTLFSDSHIGTYEVQRTNRVIFLLARCHRLGIIGSWTKVSNFGNITVHANALLYSIGE